MSTTATRAGVRNPSGPTAPKRLVVKSFVRAPSIPEDYEAVTWAKLSEAVHAVHLTTGVKYSEEELYQAVQDLCAHKFGERLYDKLRDQLQTHISNSVVRLSQHLEDPKAFLDAVYELWNNHCRQMVIIRSIFWHLDRKFALQTTGVLSLWDLGLKLLRDTLESHPTILRRIITELLHNVEAERKGEMIDRSQMASLARMLTSLGLYAMFEAPFLQESNEFYQNEGVTFMDSCDVPKYLLQVEARFNEEASRGSAYLDPLTRRPLIEILEKQLISAHVVAMLDKGFNQLCEESRVDTLTRMYNFFSRVSALDELKERFANFISTKGCAAVMDPEKDKTLVEFLLEFKDATDMLLRDAFQKNEAFVYSAKRAFEKVVNCKEGRPAELIAKFVDSYLKAGERTVSESDVEGVLDRVMVLFRAVHGKDTFEAFYKKDLSKRLLLGKSASVDMEKIMLSKLKTECGSGFTQKLEGMFTDVELCKSMMDEYQATRRPGPDTMEQYVHVLTTTYWPSYPPMTVTLPPVFRAAQEEFAAFYKGKFGEKRRLFWQHSLGHCLVRAAFPLGRKELVVSQFQTMVLLLFNEKDAWNCAEVSANTQIEVSELRRTLQSLACGKVRVLNKEPKGKDVDDTDVFTVNNDFKAKLFRIKINSIQAKETEEDVESTREAIQQDRQYQVDAAIVRIMKTRKKLSHQQLLSEVFSQLRFTAKPADLKKRIESLIEREYLERDDEDSNLYHYVA